MIVVCILAFLLFSGAMYHLLLSMNAGVYPSKYILRKRAAALGGGSVILLFVWFLFGV